MIQHHVPSPITFRLAWGRGRLPAEGRKLLGAVRKMQPQEATRERSQTSQSERVDFRQQLAELRQLAS